MISFSARRNTCKIGDMSMLDQVAVMQGNAMLLTVEQCREQLQLLAGQQEDTVDHSCDGCIHGFA